MANFYATGKPPLAMQCPHCGAYDGHEVVRTLPHHYKWDDASTTFFERIAGRDISFRKRVKRCKKCSSTFQSIELWQRYLAALIAEARKLTSQVELLKAENALLVSHRTDLNKRLQQIRKLAASRSRSNR